MNSRKFAELMGIFILLIVMNLVARRIMVIFGLQLYYDTLDVITYLIGFLIIFLYKKFKKPDFKTLKENLGQESIFLPNFPVKKEKNFHQFYDGWVNHSLIFTLVSLLFIGVLSFTSEGDMFAGGGTGVYKLSYLLVCVLIWMNNKKQIQRKGW